MMLARNSSIVSPANTVRPIPTMSGTDVVDGEEGLPLSRRGREAGRGQQADARAQSQSAHDQ